MAFLELERATVPDLYEPSRARYRELLAVVRDRLEAADGLAPAIIEVLRARRLDRHKRHNRTLAELVTHRGGD
jgi:hypothetical protein